MANLRQYDFLTNLTLTDTGRLKTPKERNPTGLTIRVYSGGQVYPSKELVDRFDLEYKTKDVNGDPTGFGLDIVDSHEWAPLKEHPRMILFAPVSRALPKVDIFARCLYTTEGKPRASVMDQGTISTVLVDLCRSMGYLNPDQKYVDLQFVDMPIKPSGGIAYIPKKIEKGPKAGEDTYERRENIVLYPFNTPENLEALATAEPEQQPVAATPVSTSI